MTGDGTAKRGVYRRLLHEARPYWPHLAGVLALGLLATPLSLLTPLPIKIVVDGVIGGAPLPQPLASWLPASRPDGVLISAAALVLVVALLSRLQEMADTVLRTYTGEKLVMRFRTLLFRHVQRLSFSYHDVTGTADSVYRIQYSAPAIQWVLVDGTIRMIGAGVKFLGIVYVTALIDFELAMVALATSPLLVVVSRSFAPRLRDQWREVYRLHSSIMEVVQEVLGAARTVAAFGKESQEEGRFVRRSVEGFKAQMKASWVQAWFGLLIGLTLAAGTAAVLFVGARHVQAGTLTLGDLLVVMSYLALLTGPLETLSTMFTHLQRSFSAAERAFGLLDKAPDVSENPHGRRIDRATGAVSFRGVSFGYDAAKPVLHDLTFDVEPGIRLGIAGKTGAGKTTLVSLLIRFWDPTSGQVLLDGVDLRDYRLADLRNQFSLVLQEPVLLSTTIAENIGYGRTGATEDEIVAAAKAANAHDFISRLPEGYATQVGERGMLLSGGERQRIALARAFLKDAPLLLLDEPTSALDVRTEAVIMDAMQRLMQGRTTFMIAHRLSTLDTCDRVLELEGGRLVEITDSAQAARSRGAIS
jgi:ATP-binding cassette subfamily B protein